MSVPYLPSSDREKEYFIELTNKTKIVAYYYYYYYFVFYFVSERTEIHRFNDSVQHIDFISKHKFFCSRFTGISFNCLGFGSVL